eukprot:g78954.t1
MLSSAALLTTNNKRLFFLLVMLTAATPFLSWKLWTHHIRPPALVAMPDYGQARDPSTCRLDSEEKAWEALRNMPTVLQLEAARNVAVEAWRRKRPFSFLYIMHFHKSAGTSLCDAVRGYLRRSTPLDNCNPSYNYLWRDWVDLSTDERVLRFVHNFTPPATCRTGSNIMLRQSWRAFANEFSPVCSFPLPAVPGENNVSWRKWRDQEPWWQPHLDTLKEGRCRDDVEKLPRPTFA